MRRKEKRKRYLIDNCMMNTICFVSKLATIGSREASEIGR